MIIVLSCYYTVVTFLFEAPKRKVTKSPAVRGAASIIAYNKFERQKRAPKSKRHDGFPTPLATESRGASGATGLKTHTIVSNTQTRRFRFCR